VFRTGVLGPVALLLIVSAGYGPVVLARAVSPGSSTEAMRPSSLVASTGEVAVGSCTGVRVGAGADLRHVMASHPAGTTFCLAAGTYRVGSPISTQVGDRVIGAGRNQTFIDGGGLPPTAEGIFLTNTHTHFAYFDIFGAPTPQAGSGTYCHDRANCGKAFALRGTSLTVRSIDCHNNGGNCIGGAGNANVTVTDLDCWSNGNAYSMTSSFRYAACIKRVAAEDSPNNTTVTSSFIHDNAGAGIWCDHCKHGLFDIENNTIVDNGSNGVQWEMSGGWTASDRALIENNIFHGNNAIENASFRGGIGISSSNDIIVRNNSFGRNLVAGVNIIYVADRNPPQPDSRGVVVRGNTMNGDLVNGCGLAGVACRNNS
jgi:hypothetical protein